MALHELRLFDPGALLRAGYVAMRVLLVEDDPRLARSISTGLTEEGMQVQVATAGRPALLELQRRLHDVCILDLQLPDISGFDVLTQARAASIATPILILTARDAVADRVTGLNQGADDYLTKPFAFAELLARLRVLVRRGTAQLDGKLRAGELELDPQAHQVRCAGEIINVSRLQFALLEFLVRHRGQVVSRTTLLQRVWGYDFDPGTNLVDVHIAQLRRKLDAPATPSIIQTIRGVGYRVGDESTAEV